MPESNQPPAARIQPSHRGQRRSWDPIDGLYRQYRRPETITAVCSRCNAGFPFKPVSLGEPKEESPGVYRILRGEIEGAIAGRGACGNCGKFVRNVSWPEAAAFKVTVPEGVVWAWNEQYVPPLRARVAGDKMLLRQLIMKNWKQAYFIARLPRYAVLVKNRARIIAALDRLTA